MRLEYSWKMTTHRGLWTRYPLHCTALRCTVLYCTVLYCTVLYCTVLYCTVLCSIVLYCIVLYCTVLYCTVLYCTVLYCTVLYCTVLHCTALHCTALHCTALHCIPLYRSYQGITMFFSFCVTSWLPRSPPINVPCHQKMNIHFIQTVLGFHLDALCSRLTDDQF